MEFQGGFQKNENIYLSGQIDIRVLRGMTPVMVARGGIFSSNFQKAEMGEG